MKTKNLDEAKSPDFLVPTVLRNFLPTNEEIDLMIDRSLQLSEEYQKRSEEEKVLIRASAIAAAQWFRDSLIIGRFKI